jgi:hypothetical protein
MRTHPIRIGLLVLALAALWFGALPVLAQETLDETYVAKDGSITFDYPGTWDIEIDDNVVIVYNDQMDVYVYSPATVEGWGWETTDPIEILNGIGEQWVSDNGYDVGNVKALTLAGRDGAYLNYMDETAPGMLVGIVLTDGTLAIVDAFGKEGEKDIADRDTVLAIAETIDVVFSGAPAALTLKDYDSGYQDAVAELRDLNLIPPGGSLLFEEDYAWFEGQGAYYQPLARNSPRTNFVMSGELSYHASDGEGLETCSLGMRVVWSGNSTSQYVDVGYASGYGVFFWSIIDNDSENDAVAETEYDIAAPHVFTIIAVDDALTVFVDGDLVFDQVPVTKATGTWGVGLTGKGPGAKCEARDIWVYTLPD